MKKLMLVANAGFTVINFRKELIETLVERGYEVVVACPKSCGIMALDDVAGAIQSLGARHIPLELSRRGLNPASELMLLYRLLKIIGREKPSHILNYTVKPVVYGSIAGWLCGVKKICSTITGVGYIFTGNTFKSKFIKTFVWLQYFFAFKCNKVIFFQNIDDLNLFASMRLLRGVNCKIVNGSGVNTKYFQADNKQVNPHTTFIMIARLLRDKGVGEYIEAARQIKSEYPDSTFYLMGALDDNPESYAPSDLARWEQEKIITYIKPNKDVRPFLLAADVFVLPSYREGTPRSILEAMCMGMPVITTDTAGCRETVEDGINGFLVPVRDSDSLIISMRRFIECPSLIESMGAKSLDLVKKKYDVAMVNQTILDAVLMDC